MNLERNPRLIFAIVLATTGLMLSAYGGFNLFQLSKIPKESFQDASAVVNAVTSSSLIFISIGLMLLAFGVLALFATQAGAVIAGGGAMLWLYGVYNLYQIGVVNPVSDALPFATGVGTFFTGAAVLYGIGAALSMQSLLKELNKLKEKVSELEYEKERSLEQEFEEDETVGGENKETQEKLNDELGLNEEKEAPE